MVLGMTPAKARLMLLAVPALWGLVFVGINRVLRYLSPLQIVAIRFALISTAFLVLMTVQPALRPRFTRSQWKLVWLAGLFGVPMSQLAIVSAQRYLDPALASLIVTTAPAAAVIIAPFFLPERITRTQGIGFAIALAGTSIVIIGGAGGASFSPRDILGASVGIITPVSWAVYTIILKRLQGNHPLATVGTGLTLGTLFLVPWMPSAASAAMHIDAETWLWLLYLGLIGTFLTYVLWYRGLSVLTAGQVVAYMYLVPVFALIWSLVILGQAPPPIGLMGGAVVFVGVGITQRSGRIPAEPDPG
jgi:drug/metabolite transporter (DMT)-like permease